jgi:hypothetical protein
MNSLSEERMKYHSHNIVISLVGESLADKWWLSPNAAFEGKTPITQWDDDPNTVFQYLLNQLDPGYS